MLLLLVVASLISFFLLCRQSLPINQPAHPLGPPRPFPSGLVSPPCPARFLSERRGRYPFFDSPAARFGITFPSPSPLAAQDFGPLPSGFDTCDGRLSSLLLHVFFLPFMFVVFLGCFLGFWPVRTVCNHLGAVHFFSFKPAAFSFFLCFPDASRITTEITSPR